MLPRMLPQIVDVRNTESRFGDTLGHIVARASDGDSQRSPVMHNLAASVRSEGIGGPGRLELMDQTTSEHGLILVQWYDLKHNLKHFRSRDRSNRWCSDSEGRARAQPRKFPSHLRHA